VNPTIPGGAYPYGGTEVGKTNLVLVQPTGTPFLVEYEGLGEVGDVLEANKRYVFSCFLRGWDDKGVEKLRADAYEAGSVSQHAVFFEPGNVVPGESALSRSVVLVYVPDDPIHVPGVLVYRGIPNWTDGAELAFQRDNELGIPLTVECVRDTSDRILRIGRLADLQLGAPHVGTLAADMLIPTMDGWAGT
jgi:hypothetical protein